MRVGGLFGASTGTIRNLGLKQASVSAANRDENLYVGSLVGWMGGGTIIGSYATGGVSGQGENDSVGGLVGWMASGTIIGSYADVGVSGRGSSRHSDSVGGLVGTNSGTIIASYATGDVYGNSGFDSTDLVGGLVGAGGRIIASYATGDVYGSGYGEKIGGLVGYGGAITASYATGDVHEGGHRNRIGGLVGEGGSITASYATGKALGQFGGGSNENDEVGVLVGSGGTTTASFGFAGSSAAALTLGTTGEVWNAAASVTLGAWDFGDVNQSPALVYNDYDGTGGTDYCALFAMANIQCGTLLPGQRADTTPQIGTTSSDIQLTAGDTADSINGNVTLPATLTVGENSLNLMWSVHHDPEKTTANKVTLGSGQLIVNAGNRTSTRRVVLRATTGSGDDKTIVNDYRLRVIQNP